MKKQKSYYMDQIDKHKDQLNNSEYRLKDDKLIRPNKCHEVGNWPDNYKNNHFKGRNTKNS
jgi:hypothetical protein